MSEYSQDGRKIFRSAVPVEKHPCFCCCGCEDELVRCMLGFEPEELEEVAYTQSLTTYTLTKASGQHSVRVHPIQYNLEPALMVRVETYAITPSASYAMTSIGCVSTSLITLEEYTIELQDVKDKPEETFTRRTFMLRERDGVYLHRKCTQGGIDVTEYLEIPFRAMKGFVSDTLSHLIAYLLGRSGKVKAFQTKGFDIFGEPATQFFNVSLPTWRQVDPFVRVKVRKVTRKMGNFKWKFTYDVEGNLFQMGLPCGVPMSATTFPWEIQTLPSGTTVPALNWENDMELVSKYLDCKEKVAAESRSYMEDHPELSHVLADFLQAALLLQPTDVYGFAQRWFMPLLARASKRY